MPFCTSPSISPAAYGATPTAERRACASTQPTDFGIVENQHIIGRIQALKKEREVAEKEASQQFELDKTYLHTCIAETINGISFCSLHAISFQKLLIHQFIQISLQFSFVGLKIRVQVRGEISIEFAVVG